MGLIVDRVTQDSAFGTQDWFVTLCARMVVGGAVSYGMTLFADGNSGPWTVEATMLGALLAR
jgi:hypothetical protein